jgi:hypothetical protein
MKLHYVLLAAVAYCLLKAVIAPGEHLVLLLGLAFGSFILAALAKTWDENPEDMKLAVTVLGGWWLLSSGFVTIVTFIVAVVLTIRT